MNKRKNDRRRLKMELNGEQDRIKHKKNMPKRQFYIIRIICGVASHVKLCLFFNNSCMKK